MKGNADWDLVQTQASEFAFEQDPQAICRHIRLGKAVLEPRFSKITAESPGSDRDWGQGGRKDVTSLPRI